MFPRLRDDRHVTACLCRLRDSAFGTGHGDFLPSARAGRRLLVAQQREQVSVRLWIAIRRGLCGRPAYRTPLRRPDRYRRRLRRRLPRCSAPSRCCNSACCRSGSTRSKSSSGSWRFSSLATALSLAAFWILLRTPTQWPALLVVMGVLSGIGQFLLVMPLRFAPASRLAPIYYCNLLGGLTIGYLWFGEVPDAAMLVGCVIVVAATALALTAGPPSAQPAPQPAAVPACESEN